MRCRRGGGLPLASKAPFRHASDASLDYNVTTVFDRYSSCFTIAEAGGEGVISVSLAVSLESLVENCHKLLEKFHYSWEMMPLVLVILNYAGSDLDEASRKIDEVFSVYGAPATRFTAHALSAGKLIVNEYARKHNLNVFDGLELRNSTRQYGL
ncbi:unnamed protein product, partial [Iphiclides podalirius]